MIRKREIGTHNGSGTHLVGNPVRKEDGVSHAWSQIAWFVCRVEGDPVPQRFRRSQ